MEIKKATIGGQKVILEMPAPLVGDHYRKWVKATKARAGDDKDEGFWTVQWRGVVACCTISIEGIAAEDITEDAGNIPLPVMTWAVRRLDEYMAPMLDPKV